MSTQRWIRAFTASVVASLATIAGAQPPSAQTDTAQQSQHASQSGRAAAEHAKPQIVYNVRSRETAEALHAQSKPATDVSLPIDGNMPISLQLSRSNANADAGAARAAEATPPTVAPRVHKQRTQGRVRSNSVPPGQAKQFAAPAEPAHGRGKHKGD